MSLLTLGQIQQCRVKGEEMNFSPNSVFPGIEDVYPIHPLEDIHPVNISKLDLKI